MDVVDPTLKADTGPAEPSADRQLHYLLASPISWRELPPKLSVEETVQETQEDFKIPAIEILPAGASKGPADGRQPASSPAASQAPAPPTTYPHSEVPAGQDELRGQDPPQQ